MTDITNTHLEAAIIDQIVAGKFNDRPYAFSVAWGKKNGWQLTVAVANEQGHNLVEGKVFKDRAEAKLWADGLNAHIGRSEESVLAIISSSMRGTKIEVM